jgi:para-nitrobenzyl esterase
VSIFGESAGGISVSMLCASPLAKGLFQRAISQSGGSLGPPRPTIFPGENMKRLADAERAGAAYAEAANVTSLAELRHLAPDKFPGGRGVGSAWPVIDGWVIPDDQVMYFSQTPHVGPVPSADSLQVLDAYFAWRRTPEGEAWAK